MIRPVETDADLDVCVRIAGEVEDHPGSAEQFRKVQHRLLVDPRGGYAYVDHSSVKDSAYAMVRVRPKARREGIGSRLVTAAIEAARELGVGSAWGVVRPGDPGSLRFAESHGFLEASRDVALTRRLSRDEGRVPEGIVELADEHREGAYAVAVAAVPDMVTAGQAEARSYEGWVAAELSGAVAVFVAVEDGSVVGYATLQPLGEDPKRLEHGFTGVLPAYRRRGIATKLGRAQLAWAAARGYEELITTTGVTNLALRRQKAKLGYAETEGPILVRGKV